MFHTPAHKVAPALPQAGTIENVPYANDPRVIVEPSPDDVVVTNHGSIYLVSPQTADGNAWCSEYMSHAQRFGLSYAVEHRFIDGILLGMIDDCLNVRVA